MGKMRGGKGLKMKNCREAAKVSSIAGRKEVLAGMEKCGGNGRRRTGTARNRTHLRKKKRKGKNINDCRDLLCGQRKEFSFFRFYTI